ncbi:MAG: hypothetical protein KIT84_00590 [Labilithrix sp.]|nr:hypothetical protein [Labilithrix sp.]MCW5809481.1 hypothetical protein [Labilithrix sp.]
MGLGEAVQLASESDDINPVVLTTSGGCTSEHPEQLFPITGDPGTIDRVSSPTPARTADAIRAELLAGVDVTAADERLLVELAANAAAIALQTGVAADRLAHVLPGVLADARKAAMVAKTLHEVVMVGNALVRRIEGTLATAATLRLQRRVRRGSAE